MPKTNKKTHVREKFDEAQTTAFSLMDVLEDQILHFEFESYHEPGGVNWGYVGSMNYVNKQLQEIVDYLDPEKE